jgi:hydrogenase nickel incorporation protein HypA/HybF
VHELSICDSIARTAVRHAGGRRVRSVRLQVGALRQVVPDTLAFCWTVAATDPLLAGSVLDVELVPAEVECRQCGARSALSRFVISCPDCEGPVTVVAGEELLVVSLEVDDAPGEGAAGEGAAGEGGAGEAAPLDESRPGRV